MKKNGTINKTFKPCPMPKNSIMALYKDQLMTKGKDVNIKALAELIGEPQANLWRAINGANTSTRVDIGLMIKLEAIGFLELPDNIIVINK